MIFGRKKGKSVVTENPKGRIAKNFGKTQRGDHSNLLGKLRHWRRDRKSHQKLLGAINSVK